MLCSACNDATHMLYCWIVTKDTLGLIGWLRSSGREQG